MPTWVKSMTPVTSPTAQTPSAAPAVLVDHDAVLAHLDPAPPEAAAHDAGPPARRHQ
jgi:hypothetical protein